MLGQVCRAWNEIVISHPSLWATFDLNVDFDLDDVSSQTILSTTENMLRASKNHPLDIRISVSDHLHPAVLLVVAESQRWIRARLLFNDPRPFWGNGPLKCLEGNVPLLEYIEISASEDLDDDTTLFSVAPRLRHICMEYLDSTQVLLPWSQIRALTYKRGLVQEAAYCLRVVKQLQQLDLYKPIINDLLE